MASNRAQEGSTETELADVIRWVRGHKVILDQDLACLYSVEVRALNQAVKRNPDRFPADFMFQLTAEEAEFLRSQSVILESDARSVAASKRRVGRGRHAKYLPNAFTEQGVAMLSSVLRSNRAVLVNIEIMRAFVRLRGILSSNADLARKLAVLEAKYDKQFKVVFDAIRQLMTPPLGSKHRIGFAPWDMRLEAPQSTDLGPAVTVDAQSSPRSQGIDDGHYRHRSTTGSPPEPPPRIITAASRRSTCSGQPARLGKVARHFGGCGPS